MAEDKIIKSGQLTLSRILFLGLCGGVIVATVYLGGVWLTVGYWLLTLGICALLVLIAMEYGVNLDPVNAQSSLSQTVDALETADQTEGAQAEARDSRPRRRATRSKRRR